MKRMITVAALVAAAVVPATSSAGSTHEAAARGGNNLQISFVVRSVDGDPRAIKNFRFKNFTVSCASGGPVDLSGQIDRMRINDAGKFDGNARKGDGKVHVEGEVKQNGDKVVGFLKSKGNFGDAEDCQTKVNWKAVRPGNR